MAEQAVPVNANPMAGIAALLQSLGGQRATSSTNAGDTAALQSVLQQLQGTNYEQLLQSIFAQAGGQIPGLQAAYGNAIGARSGGNTAVQAALQKLLQQTTLLGQQQIAQQQAQNLQTQTQAAQGIAQATRGTTTKQTSGTNLGQAAQMIAGLQLFSKLRDMTKEGGSLSDMFGGKTTGVQSTPVSGGGSVMATDLAPLDLSAGQDLFAPAELPANFDQPLDLGSLFGDGGMLGGLDFNDPAILDELASYNNDDLTGGFSDEPLSFDF